MGTLLEWERQSIQLGRNCLAGHDGFPGMGWSWSVAQELDEQGAGHGETGRWMELGELWCCSLSHENKMAAGARK